MGNTFKKNKKKIIYSIGGIAIVGGATLSTVLAIEFSKDKNFTDSRIAKLQKILQGNSLAANAFRVQMFGQGGAGIINQNKILKNSLAGTSETKIKEGYIKGFKTELGKWLNKYKVQLKTLDFTADLKTIISWFDFTKSTITKDGDTPTWDYTDGSAAKKISPYQKYDIKIPIKNSGSANWKFKVITYLDPNDAELTKALKFKVDEKAFIGKKDSSGKNNVENPLFNAVTNAAHANDNVAFKAAVKELSKDLALKLITNQIDGIKELADLKIHYNKMNSITDMQKFNIDLAKYNNDLEVDSNGQLRKVKGHYNLKTPDSSTIVKAIVTAFDGYGIDHFKTWVDSTTQKDGDYETINGKQGYKIDIAKFIKPNNSVNILDYQYEINGELSTAETQSWTHGSEKSFYIMRPDEEAKQDILKAILDARIQDLEISKSRQDKTNLVEIIKRIQGLLTNKDIVKELGKDKLWFELNPTGNTNFDNTNLKIDANTVASTLADKILALTSSTQIAKIFGIEHTQGNAKTPSKESAYIQGSFKLESVNTGSSQTISIGGTSHSQSKIHFKIDRKILNYLEAFGIISNSLTKEIAYTKTIKVGGKLVDRNPSQIKASIIDALKSKIETDWNLWKNNNSFNPASLLPLAKDKIIVKNFRVFDKVTIVADIYYQELGSEILVTKGAIISVK